MSDRGAPQLAGLLALGAIAWIVGYWMWPDASQPGEPPVSMTRATGDDLVPDDRTVIDDETVAPDPLPVLPPDPEPVVDEETAGDEGDGFDVEPPTFRIHTVAAGGETLQDLSRIYYGTTAKWRAIARMNGHSVDPNRLFPGTEVKVPLDPDNVQGAPMDDEAPPPEPEVEYTEYIVSRDDSLWTIARALYGNGAKWPVIRDANRELVGDQGQRLRPGMVLRIPPPPGD